MAPSTETRPQTVDVSLPAARLFRSARVHGLALRDAQDVTLARGELIENDAYGAGRRVETDGGDVDSHEILTDKVWVRKRFVLSSPAADSVTLAWYGKEPADVTEEQLGPASLRIRINGADFLKPPVKFCFPEGCRQGRSLGWRYLEVPASALKTGTNEVVFAASENFAWTLYLSEYKHFAAGGAPDGFTPPKASAVSRDGGRTWSTDGLCVNRAMAGEYIVRLNLDRYRAQGTLISEVMDILDLEEQRLLNRHGVVRRLQAEVVADTPTGTDIALEVRAGNHPRVSPNHWTVWMPAQQPGGVKTRGRYAQFRITARTEDAMRSPVISALHVKARGEEFPIPGDRVIHVREVRNPAIVRTSFPFEYESFDTPALVELRRQYGLDNVVAGAGTEFEKIMALRNWTADQFARSELVGRRPPFPPWDARVILQGQGYFCLHHAITFTQVCLAFGIQCRVVTMNSPKGGGHEVVEVWSDDYGKWIFIDPGYNYYVYDTAKGVPLSLLEVQRALSSRQDKALLFRYPGLALPVPAKVKVASASPALQCAVEPSAMNDYTGYRNFAARHLKHCFFLRYMPRNNFLAKPTPIPLNHGTTHWPWNGYMVWADDVIPRLPHYSGYAAREGDLYWTLNQVHMRMVYGPRENEVVVHLDTVTPDFSDYLASMDNGGARQTCSRRVARDGSAAYNAAATDTDSGEWRPVNERFIWTLHPGVNRLQVKTRKRNGKTGPVSLVSLSAY